VNWVIDSWRLKLLALGLSVLMLGAVAFSQNPPTFKTLTVSNFQWTMPPDLIVINAPTKTTVRVTGLADTIPTVTADRLQAKFDLSKAKPGPAVQVNLVVTSQVAGVNVQNSSVPFALNIDRRATVPLTVKVRPPRAAPGWVVTKAEARCPASPCVVHFDGPASWENDASGKPNLNAYVDLTAPVGGDKFVVGNLPPSLEQSGTPLDATNFSKTVPVSGLDLSGVEVQVEAKTATTTKQVVLINSPPSHGPPPGYSVRGISVDPLAVVITGPADVLIKYTTLSLPPVDLSGHTSTFAITLTIPYPAGVSGSAQIARVTYSISPDPNVQASPSPTP
jgi:YbbR domain-containing protein